jgi:hypothetical protein
LNYFDIVRPTDLTDQIPDGRRYLAPQHRLAILRNEDEVVVQGINRVRCPSILLHRPASYRKPPEGVA